MTPPVVCIKVEPANASQPWQNEAVEQVNRSEEQVVLDFSAVERIDVSMAAALGRLADHAGQRSATVALRGINVGVYKVLRLLRLASKFSYVG